MREAPALSIIATLQDAGASVRGYDPESVEQARTLLPGVEFADNAYDCVAGADAVAILTEWDKFRALDLARLSPGRRAAAVRHGTRLRSGPTSTSTLRRSASASGCEKVVSSTRACGSARSRRTARCSATTVLPVPAEPAMRSRIELQVERRGLHRLLLGGREAREGVGEGVGDAEVHQNTRLPQAMSPFGDIRGTHPFAIAHPVFASRCGARRPWAGPLLVE